MEVIKYPLTDTATQTTFHGLQKITATNGEFCFVTNGGEIYHTLREYIERQITWHSFMIDTFKRDCNGLRRHQANLESWKRMLDNNKEEH